jgi:transcriptional regulator with XRE-family HTH domain
MGFGLHLKEILRERGMTIKQLSEDSGISVNTLYSITKRDSLRVDPVILKKIAQTLGLSVTELIGSTNSSGETDIGLVALGISELLDIDDREAVFEAVSEIIPNQDPFSPEVLKAIRKRAKELKLRNSIQKTIEASLHSPKISFNIANYLNTEQTNKGKVINEISKLLDFLNEDGQLEAVKRIEELTEISKYQHIDPPMDEEK